MSRLRGPDVGTALRVRHGRDRRSGDGALGGHGRNSVGLSRLLVPAGDWPARRLPAELETPSKRHCHPITGETKEKERDASRPYMEYAAPTGLSSPAPQNWGGGASPLPSPARTAGRGQVTTNAV